MIYLNFIADAAVNFLVTASIIAAILSLAAWAVITFGRVHTAVYRHTIWLYCLIGVAVLPMLWQYAPKLILPVLPIRAPSVVQPEVAPVPSAVVSEQIKITPADARVLPREDVLQPVIPLILHTERISINLVLTVCWLLGTLFMLCRLSISWMRLRILCRHATRRPELEHRYRDSGRIRVLIARGIDTPICYGLFRPTIILPGTLFENSESSDFTMMMSHEIAHIKRHDYAINLLQRLAESVYFFHPLVWHASARLTHERELVCDNWVLAGDIAARDYASLLTDLAERSRSKIPLHGLALFEGGLLERVRNILDTNRSGRTRLPLLTACATAVVLIALFAACGVLRLSQAPAETETQGINRLPDYSEILAFYPENHGYRVPTAKELSRMKGFWPKVPPQENAAFYYVEAASMLPPISDAPGSSCSSSSKFTGDAEAMRASLQKWIGRNHAGLQEVLRGQDKQTCMFPTFINAKNGELEMNSRIIQLSKARHLARTLADAGVLEELKGNPEKAVDWYLACVLMGQHFYGDTFMIDHLVGMAISGIGHYQLHRLITHTDLDDETLLKIISVCRSSELGKKGLANMHRVETALSTYLLETSHPYIEWGDKAILAKYLRDMDQIAGLQLAELLNPNTIGQLKNSSNPDTKMYGHFLSKHGRVIATSRATQLYAAIAMYSKRHGSSPEKLSQLVPGIVRELPVDIFTGKPFRYALHKDGTWKFWSVSDDFKDNGGTTSHNRFRPDMVFLSSSESNVEMRMKKD